MTMNTLNKTLSIAILSMAVGMTSASARMSTNPTDYISGDTMERIDTGITKGKIAKDIYDSSDIDPAKTVSNGKKFVNGLKVAGKGLWGFGKAYGKAIVNEGNMIYGAGKTVYGAGKYGVGYVAGSDKLKDSGKSHMNRGASRVVGTAKTVPSNMMDLVNNGIQTGTGVEAMVSSGGQLVDTGIKAYGVYTLIAAICL